jgi:hypothetical protein
VDRALHRATSLRERVCFYMKIIPVLY